jgi:hypothetical protein
LIYGTGGIGKSTFAAKCPSPVFIPTEDGLDALGVDAFPLMTSLKQVSEALDQLSKDSAHTYKTVVIDSLDWLEKLVFVEACAQYGVNSIADVPFGKGFAYAEILWKELLGRVNKLNVERKMLVVLIAHSQITRFEDPSVESYDRYSIDLQRKAAGLVYEYCDIVGFANYKIVTKSKDTGFGGQTTKGISSGERVLYVEERPAFLAKNRYGLPAQLPFAWMAISDVLKKHKKKEGDLSAVVEAKLDADLKTISKEAETITTN